MSETLVTLGDAIRSLAASTDEQFAAVASRFDAVDKRFDAVDKRFEEVDKRFEEVDKRFEEVDKRFEEIDKRFDAVSEAFVEQRQYTEFAFEKLKQELTAEMRGGFGRLDRKLDRVLDALGASPRRRRRS